MKIEIEEGDCYFICGDEAKSIEYYDWESFIEFCNTGKYPESNGGYPDA